MRAISGSEHDRYVDALAAGFEGPRHFFVDAFAPVVLDTPGITAYLTEFNGVVVSTGMARLNNGHAMISNISTPPEYRRRGYGTLVTEAIMADAQAAGAHTAALTASDERAQRLYTAMGFRTVGHWTHFTAPTV